ncbi:MAG: Restriction of telomere capping protein 5 [Piccolia ochrophora]|nr:MAG: Restriction of telomere capping protein 5 [Piccolia ochrophora]
MGQTQSGEHGSRNISTEQLSHELAVRFAKRCFTPLELYSFKDVFRTLADTQSHVHYWREETLCRFLELPDVLTVGPVLYQSAAYLGAFPFPSLAPSILDFEALLKVVVIMTERYRRVLKRGNTDRVRLLFRSLAVFDRGVDTVEKEGGDSQRTPEEHQRQGGHEKDMAGATAYATGFAVDRPAHDDEDEDEDDDELALAALDSLDAIEVFKHGEKSNINHAQIPSDNFRRLLMLLIITAPLDAQESLSQHSGMFSGGRLERLRTIADSILWAFGVEKHPGILYHDFNAILPTSLPYLFDGLNPLFEHFLFSKNVEQLHRRTPSSPPANSAAPSSTTIPPSFPTVPLLSQEGNLLDFATLSQLSFFLKGTTLFRRLRPLYSGSSAGFSMGSFESRVFNWQAPSILLVSGTRVTSSDTHTSNDHTSSTQRSFEELLPPKRFPNSSTGNSSSNYVTYGVYLSSPWKHTPTSSFGDDSSLLFQLAPIHEVFPASTVSTSYASFVKPPHAHAGIAFGCPPTSPRAHQVSTSDTASRSLGPVSLVLDDALQYAVFTHTATGGGSFHASETRRTNWQDRFEIEEVEVWGIGGEDEEKKQKEARKWEESEAERRRRVNVGRGDVGADRALLEMAGLIGAGRSGGSV